MSTNISPQELERLLDKFDDMYTVTVVAGATPMPTTLAAILTDTGTTIPALIGTPVADVITDINTLIGAPVTDVMTDINTLIGAPVTDVMTDINTLIGTAPVAPSPVDLFGLIGAPGAALTLFGNIGNPVKAAAPSSIAAILGDPNASTLSDDLIGLRTGLTEVVSVKSNYLRDGAVFTGVPAADRAAAIAALAVPYVLVWTSGAATENRFAAVWDFPLDAASVIKTIKHYEVIEVAGNPGTVAMYVAPYAADFTGDAGHPLVAAVPTAIIVTSADLLTPGANDVVAYEGVATTGATPVAGGFKLALAVLDAGAAVQVRVYIDAYVEFDYLRAA